MSRMPLVAQVLLAVFAYTLVRDRIVDDKVRAAARALRKVMPL